MEKVEIGTATIYHGDFQDIMPSLSDGAIDCVASDPPYGVTDHHWDQVPPLDKMWQLFEAKSKNNANFVLFGCGGFTIDLINSRRAWYRYCLTWIRNNKTGWLNSSLMPMRNTEDIMIFGKPGHQKTAVFNVPYGGTHPCSALAFDHDRGNNQQGLNFHETQKPMHLMAYLIMLYSNENDLVLDPFCGSCTTGLAAMKLHRRFIGIEREKKYYDISCQRLEEEHRRRCNRRRTSFMSFPANPYDANQTTPEAEPAEELKLMVSAEQHIDTNLVHNREEQYNASIPQL
jgi:site-specific DNA-methyltransferase (adenine-specific)